jgi:hypothetical protein
MGVAGLGFVLSVSLLMSAETPKTSDTPAAGLQAVADPQVEEPAAAPTPTVVAPSPSEQALPDVPAPK